jgi:hypothetical protein
MICSASWCVFGTYALDLARVSALLTRSVLDLTPSIRCAMLVLRHPSQTTAQSNDLVSHATFRNSAIIIIWFVKLLAVRPILAYCASLG